MKKTAYECFVDGFRYLLEKRRVTQAGLARTIEKTTVHINDVLAGRKKASSELQEAIADFFDQPLEEIIRMGRQLSEGEQSPFIFHYEASKLPAKSVSRAALIYRKAAESMGLQKSMLFSEHALKHAQMPGWEEYLKGKMGDEELYEMALREWERILVNTRKKLVGRKMQTKPRDLDGQG
jgi:hypothetical protein